MTRTAFAASPPRVVHELAPHGPGPRDVLEAMREWGGAVPDRVIEAEGHVVDGTGRDQTAVVAQLKHAR